MKSSFNRITNSEADKVIPLMRKLYEHDNNPFHDDSAKTALINLINNSKHGRAYTISANGQLAGYIIITFGYSLEFRGRDAFIDELFIDEEFRKKGLGTEAIKFAEQVCVEQGIRALHLEVERENLKAQNVYRKNGFKDHNRYLMTKWM